MEKQRIRGLPLVMFMFFVFVLAKCKKAEELVDDSQEPATAEVIYEGDSIVYMKAWDTLKPQKLLITKDTTKRVMRAPTQKAKKKKTVVRKKKFRSIQDRENAEFEEWYRKRHKK